MPQVVIANQMVDQTVKLSVTVFWPAVSNFEKKGKYPGSSRRERSKELVKEALVTCCHYELFFKFSKIRTCFISKVFPFGHEIARKLMQSKAKWFDMFCFCKIFWHWTKCFIWIRINQNRFCWMKCWINICLFIFFCIK